jgi:hypothetical protein
MTERAAQSCGAFVRWKFASTPSSTQVTKPALDANALTAGSCEKRRRRRWAAPEHPSTLAQQPPISRLLTDTDPTRHVLHADPSIHAVSTVPTRATRRPHATATASRRWRLIVVPHTSFAHPRPRGFGTVIVARHPDDGSPASASRVRRESIELASLAPGRPPIVIPRMRGSSGR